MTDDQLDQMTNLTACTLPTAQRPTRLAEFDRFFAEYVHATHRPDPTRLELRLADADDAEPVGRDLAARESACCSFFTFTFEPVGGTTMMRIAVPAAHIAVLDALASRAEAAVAQDRP